MPAARCIWSRPAWTRARSSARLRVPVLPGDTADTRPRGSRTRNTGSTRRPTSTLSGGAPDGSRSAGLRGLPRPVAARRPPPHRLGATAGGAVLYRCDACRTRGGNPARNPVITDDEARESWALWLSRRRRRCWGTPLRRGRSAASNRRCPYSVPYFALSSVYHRRGGAASRPAATAIRSHMLLRCPVHGGAVRLGRHLDVVPSPCLALAEHVEKSMRASPAWPARSAR